MKLGLCLPQLGPHSDGARVASFARAAEELGYEALWVGDRVLAPLAPSDLYPAGGTPEHPYPPEFTAVLDPLITLTAAATATTSVRLGTGTLTATWHNALLLGRALTTLDAVSGGRLDVGFGTSWLRDEYAAVGVPWEERGSRLDEILDVLHEMWTENPVEHRGAHFDIPRSHVDLRPAQTGGPPILLGGFGTKALERVGRRASGWIAVWGMPREYLEGLWQIAKRSAVTAGRDPGALRREVRINVAPGQSAEDLSAVVAYLRQHGVDGAFLDFTYATRTVDESLAFAAAAIDTARARS
jgi:probable F420-dependent oxidoreductase